MFSMSSPTRHRRTVSGTDQVPMLVQAKLSRKRSLTDFVNRLSHPFRTHRVRTVTYSTNVQEYQFLQRIGQGATASVFAVMHEPSDTLLAVKTVNLEKLEMQHEPVLLESLRKEIQIMKLCRHPHVVPVLQSFVDTSHLFVVMPLMCSGSCRDLLLMLDHGLEEPLIACVTRQVILGLLYLHQNDLVHRDVKTANLLLDGDTGMVKLADFGVSSFLWIDQDEPDPSPPRTSNDSDWACFSSNTSTARIPLLQQQQQQQQLADSYQEDTVVGHQLRSDARQHRLSVRWQRAVRKSFVGTPLYIAPEILREEAYDNKVDMWALGITLLELAQGRPPYHEHDALTVN
ncbi:kinase-like protein [Hesseltinella vesiculosa]|uniref:non-specific serine/threonine protein kinase n=1 Tax=Hesseltinella vesiculosa TaxID=101127 RepID=A0A1X2G8J1_9FUNG|nr:kinase-like protein [Hesseltinella vesiculosa]